MERYTRNEVPNCRRVRDVRSEMYRRSVSDFRVRRSASSLYVKFSYEKPRFEWYYCDVLDKEIHYGGHKAVSRVEVFNERLQIYTWFIGLQASSFDSAASIMFDERSGMQRTRGEAIHKIGKLISQHLVCIRGHPKGV
jgi:hypothetical protein